MNAAAPWYVLRHIGTKRYMTCRPPNGFGASGDIARAYGYPSREIAEGFRQYLREFAETYEVMQVPTEAA